MGYQSLGNLETWDIRRAKLNSMFNELYSLINGQLTPEFNNLSSEINAINNSISAINTEIANLPTIIPTNGGTTIVNEMTLFVDPSGNDSKALPNELANPFGTIAGAVNYLASHHLQGYTIVIFPGVYTETPLIFQNDATSTSSPYANNNNTTIRLLGDVHVMSTGVGIILDNTNAYNTLNVSIIGENIKNTTIDSGDDTIHFISSATSPSNSRNINLNLQGLTISVDRSGYDTGDLSSNNANITYSGYVSGKFTADNCSFINPYGSNIKHLYGASLAVWDVTMNVKNIYWEVGGSYIYPNWDFALDDFFGTVTHFNIENSKFYNCGLYSVNKDFHISTATANTVYRYNIQMANVIFYSVSGGSCLIWHNNNTTSNSNGTELLLTGTVVTNRNTVQNVNIPSILQPTQDNLIMNIDYYQD